MGNIARLLLTFLCAWVFSGPALAGSYTLRAGGGDVRPSSATRIVLLEGRSTVHLPTANEKNPPIVVVVFKPAAAGSVVLVDGQTIQGLESLRLEGAEASAVFYPVNGLGYVR
ncbi:hypothetical protein [Bradyrhizobium sp. 144]|uniref:hypothetical protein n=1 Tax=Bradyrhizobium sp. 144 TaxID=2782620 RepID=UPI001FF8A426|nr:hypothetical protein [Bradyrhizobium sp. 144]MCK1693836.1 hypothetical protein [Bradyrhizobium sp. 144]